MIRADIKGLSAYHVPDAKGMIKLDAMENPYPLPETVRRALAERLATASIHRYPDAAARRLRQRIATHEGVAPEQVLIGNGSDEIIQMLILAVKDGPCIAPAPTFVMYEVISRWLRRPYVPVPLEENFALDADRFLHAASRERARLAFLACPNNPTGNLWEQDTIARIRDGFGGLLVIDEAYAPFSERNHLHLMGKRTAVLRTFSKLGWAGLRLGYLIADAELIEHVNKVRLPYNINTLSQLAAEVLFDHFEAFEAQAARIRDERARLARELGGIPGAEVFPSQTNFITLRLPRAEQVFEHLLVSGILIKRLGGHPLLRDCLRITVGTREENDRLLAALKEACR
ncbi:MAG: histidinol-phosphate transaminase [Zetaproteobacteria bacterium]|nr:MAG: histidinol-phosphate transaminase [Zetaproteobacteria bacterium]